MKLRMYSKLLCIAVTSLLMTGCATNASVRKVHDEAEYAKQTAEHALSVANEAKQTALAADDRSKKTEEALNRGFKKAMRK